MDQGPGRGGGPIARPLRVVLDTNVLVGAAYQPGSASRCIIDACLWGELIHALSAGLRQEYERTLARAVKGNGDWHAVLQFLDTATLVEPGETPRVVPDDPADDKLVALARAAGADAIVTSDRHLIALDPLGSVRILRPESFLRSWHSSFGRSPSAWTLTYGRGCNRQGSCWTRRGARKSRSTSVSWVALSCPHTRRPASLSVRLTTLSDCNPRRQMPPRTVGGQEPKRAATGSPGRRGRCSRRTCNCPDRRREWWRSRSHQWRSRRSYTRLG
jgi:putative PIN family toxin of toxin-antitoxin system